MSSSWEMSAELSVEQLKRRNAVFKAIMDVAGYEKAFLESFFKRSEEKVARYLAGKGLLPTLSANYFSWSVERHLWAVIVGENKDSHCPKFPFAAAPNKYGSPYSEVFMSYLAENDAQEEIAGRLRELEQIALGQPRAEGRETPAGLKRHPEFLEALWKKMFGVRDYEKGCGEPFVVRLLCNDGVNYFHECIARSPDETNTVAQRAAFLLGGREVVLIVITDGDNRVFLALDFEEAAEKESPAVQYRFQNAWLDLLRLHVQWLSGKNVGILSYLHELNANRLGARFMHVAAETEKELEARQDLRAVAKRDASTIAPIGVSTANYEASLAGIVSLVRDERFTCIPKYELMAMVETQATNLVSLHVEMGLDRSESPHEFERSLDDFVVDPDWDDIMSPHRRIDYFESTLAKIDKIRPLAEAWAAKTRTRTAAKLRGGELAEGMSRVSLSELGS
ncbi:hypothetical protein F4814DRAFT_450680 [Daldinia grandis]|nr:hypothetical protein F4814DRAFT_450680 [Daldinia grandis]